MPLSRVKLEQGTVEPPPPAAAAPPTTTPAATTPSTTAAVRPTLPTPPTARRRRLTQRNTLHRGVRGRGERPLQGEEVRVAIRTYGDAVDALATIFLARADAVGLRGARAVRAVLLERRAVRAQARRVGARGGALRAGDALQAEDGDLVKVLHRHGQALNGSGDADSARAMLGAPRGGAGEPRGAGGLQKAKKAAALAKTRDSALFGAVDLGSRRVRNSAAQFARNSGPEFGAQFSDRRWPPLARRGSRQRRSS